MFWVLSASPCNKLLNAHLCVWEMCVFKSWSYLTAQTISSQAEKYFLSRFWFYWVVLHVPELSLATTHIRIHIHTQLRFKDHTGLLSLALFHRWYTLCGYKRGWCREEEEKILIWWQWMHTGTENTGGVSTMALWGEDTLPIYSNPLTLYCSLPGEAQDPALHMWLLLRPNLFQQPPM